MAYKVIPFEVSTEWAVGEAAGKLETLIKKEEQKGWRCVRMETCWVEGYGESMVVFEKSQQTAASR